MFTFSSTHRKSGFNHQIKYVCTECVQQLMSVIKQNLFNTLFCWRIWTISCICFKFLSNFFYSKALTFDLSYVTHLFIRHAVQPENYFPFTKFFEPFKIVMLSIFHQFCIRQSRILVVPIHQSNRLRLTRLSVTVKVLWV